MARKSIIWHSSNKRKCDWCGGEVSFMDNLSMRRARRKMSCVSHKQNLLDYVKEELEKRAYWDNREKTEADYDIEGRFGV